MPRSARIAAACFAAGALVACSGTQARVDPVAIVDAAAADPVPVEAPVEVPVGAAVEDPPAPHDPWAVAPVPTALPARSLAEIRHRPDLLADRRLPTPDVLPPPADDAFTSSVGPITPEIQHRMGESWSPACPVGLDQLRYVTVTFRGFDGAPHTGELVVNAAVADAVVEVFRALYAEDFPIEEMRLITTADHHAPPTGDGNVTAGYNCRTARGQKRWSAHAYGNSVDINPFQNPMVRRGTVVPELGGAYVDRAHVRPGMLTPDGPAVRAFRAAGWQWGGDWTYSKDYMHFSTDGT